MGINLKNTFITLDTLAKLITHKLGCEVNVKPHGIRASEQDTLYVRDLLEDLTGEMYKVDETGLISPVRG